MRIFTLFLMVLMSITSGFTQNAPINFESGGFGAEWIWTVFENNSNPPLDIIDNPDPSGSNTSAKVARFTALQAGNPWAGCESLEGNLGSFQWDENNRILKIMVWKSVISDVGIKFDAGAPPNDWAEPEIKVANTKINEWEELTFDFSNASNPPAQYGDLKRIIIFPDFNLAGRSQDNVIYIDNITFNPTGGGASEPTVAAPTPTRDPADVISLFSDAYNNVPVDTWRTPWSSANLEDIEIAGNATKKYSNLDFVGIETVANQLNVSEMTHIHMDIWSPDFTMFGIKLVDFGADGAFGGGDDVEHQIDINAPAQGQWVSLDIPLADFAGLTTRSNLAQYILVGRPVGTNTVFLDNMYFYKTQGGGTEPTVAAPTPTRDASKVISLFSDAYSNVAVDTWRTPWSSAELEDVEIAGNATKKYSNLDFVGIETVANQLDITGMTHVHMDVWSPDFELFGIKLVDFGADGAFGGGDDVEHQIDINTPAQGEWVSLDIPLSSFVGLTTRSNLAQYILVGRPVGANTVFLDNFYFYNSESGPTEPTVAAPTPTREAAKVISLFSDAYSNVAVDTWRTPWSSAVLDDVEIAGNATKKYSNLDFVGIETVANQIDISGMTHVHMDVWSADFTLFGIKLVDFGADGAFGGGDDVEHQIDINAPAQGEWVSLDIPLADFAGLTTRKNMAQYILVGRPVGTNTVFVDNFYFYDNRTTSTQSYNLDDSIQMYPNPVKSGNQVQFTSEVNRIEVMDLQGKMVKMVQTPQLSTSGLPTGMYIVKLYTGAQKVAFRKLHITE
jgi:hypothetical protein